MRRQLGVTVKERIVTLSGHVASYAEKLAAERCTANALRVFLGKATRRSKISLLSWRSGKGGTLSSRSSRNAPSIGYRFSRGQFSICAHSFAAAVFSLLEQIKEAARVRPCECLQTVRLAFFNGVLRGHALGAKL